MIDGSEEFINFDVDEFKSGPNKTTWKYGYDKKHLYHIGDIKDKLFTKEIIIKKQRSNLTPFIKKFYEYDKNELQKLKPLPDNSYFKNFHKLEFLIM